MLKKVLNKLSEYTKIILAKFGVKRNFEINGYSIQLDYTSSIPDFMTSFPKYDRFLPHLVKYLPKESLVIDVGANVGTSVIAMASNNDKIEYLSIEADEYFFKLLKKNIERAKKKKVNLKISILNEFIGKNITDVSLSGNGSTKKAQLGKGNIISKSLSKIIQNLNYENKLISLIKSDVDGYDWDVISSSYELLSYRPYIYFECQYDDETQYIKFKEMFLDMISLGYSNFAFFDNYGEHICTVNDQEKIFDLLNYVKKQNFNQSTRTFYYYDVFAFSSDNEKKGKQIINEYNLF